MQVNISLQRSIFDIADSSVELCQRLGALAPSPSDSGEVGYLFGYMPFWVGTSDESVCTYIS